MMMNISPFFPHTKEIKVITLATVVQMTQRRINLDRSADEWARAEL